MLKYFTLFLSLLAGCSSAAVSRQELNKSIVERYGERSRLMRGDDSISQAIIDRYCLAERKDEDGRKPDAEDKYQNGWRPWLCGPFPATYTSHQNADGTYHIRYEPSNLDAAGNPKDVWNHKGVKNVEFEEFMEGLKKLEATGVPDA